MKENFVRDLSSEAQELAQETALALRESYLADDRPWVIAFSGGKDSSLVLQLVYDVLIGLGGDAKKVVYVLASDTQVETPRIEAHLRESIRKLGFKAAKDGVPIVPLLVEPMPKESFWGKLIGKGYPPPTRNFRWCTSNIKIKPARRAIESIIQRHGGSVVLLLGSRRAESSARKQRMDLRRINSRGLNPHHEIPNTFVMSPISDWETETVWEFLVHSQFPAWGGDNHVLAELYRDASGEECPLVLDLTTPSCGGSRFGCWTCTVVKQDRSLNGFIKSGDSELLLYKHFCDLLRVLREDPSRRLSRRRNGTPGLGPFNPQTRKKLLSELLKLERAVGRELISDEILKHIQSCWTSEFDLSRSVQKITAEQGRQFVLPGGQMLISEEKQTLIYDVAEKANVSPSLLRAVLALSSEFPDMSRYGAKSGMRQRIKELVSAAQGSEEADFDEGAGDDF